jgi:hypothetical protein
MLATVTSVVGKAACALMVNRTGPTFQADGHTAREATSEALKQAKSPA